MQIPLSESYAAVWIPSGAQFAFLQHSKNTHSLSQQLWGIVYGQGPLPGDKDKD